MGFNSFNNIGSHFNEDTQFTMLELIQFSLEGIDSFPGVIQTLYTFRIKKFIIIKIKLYPRT
jgi:hypothetical protein